MTRSSFSNHQSMPCIPRHSVIYMYRTDGMELTEISVGLDVKLRSSIAGLFSWWGFTSCYIRLIAKPFMERLFHLHI